MSLFSSYVLMNKDTPLFEFRIAENTMDEHFEILESYSEQRPYGFKDITTWISARRAPKHREHIAHLLAECGCLSLEGYLNVTHALTLNDSFWVKSSSSSLTWKKVSLYSNDFDETIARIAFEGGLYGQQFSTTSPEFGTSGSYAKCWVRRSDNIYLLKAGSTGASNTGLEPYSEYYAAQLAKLLCNSYVPYELEMYRGRLASSCPLFTNESIGFIPAYALAELKTLDDVYNLYRKYGFEEDFANMMILDSIIFNEDRHSGNFGFLMNNDTLEIIGMAPVFDHNVSLLPYMIDSDMDNINDYMRAKGPRFGKGFIENANILMTENAWDKIENLKNFHFERNSKYNLPEYRLQFLEKMIQHQIVKMDPPIRQNKSSFSL